MPAQITIQQAIAILRDLHDFSRLLAKLRADMARYTVLSDPWVALAQRETACVQRIQALTEQLQ